MQVIHVVFYSMSISLPCLDSSSGVGAIIGGVVGVLSVIIIIVIAVISITLLYSKGMSMSYRINKLLQSQQVNKLNHCKIILGMVPAYTLWTHNKKGGKSLRPCNCKLFKEVEMLQFIKLLCR